MLRPRRAPTRALTEAILRVADGAGDRFDGGPAQQPGALLGDPATGRRGCHRGGVGSARPMNTTGRGGEPAHGAHLGENTAANTGPPSNACTAS